MSTTQNHPGYLKKIIIINFNELKKLAMLNTLYGSQISQICSWYEELCYSSVTVPVLVCGGEAEAQFLDKTVASQSPHL